MLFRSKTHTQFFSATTVTATFLGIFLGFSSTKQVSGFSIDGGSDYAILFEGGGGNTLQVTNVTTNGNVGVGNTGKLTDSGPSTINGRIDFSAPDTGQFSNNNNANVFTGPFYNVAAVTTALNNVNSLNSTLGAEPGTAVAINGSTTINAANGTPDANGNEVFTVTSFSTTNGDTLTINGDGVHDVVLNIGFGINFNNQVVLNGITSDHVLYNLVGGSNLTGGPTLQVNNQGDNAHPDHLAQGIFLDPNGTVHVTSSRLLGRVFGGDTQDFQDVSGSTILVPEASTSVLFMVGIICAFVGLRGRLKAG